MDPTITTPYRGPRDSSSGPLPHANHSQNVPHSSKHLDPHIGKEATVKLDQISLRLAQTQPVGRYFQIVSVPLVPSYNDPNPSASELINWRQYDLCDSLNHILEGTIF